MIENPRWHVVWIDEEGGRFVVRCIPHGLIGESETHREAFLCAYAHDFDVRGDLTMPGYDTNR